MNGSLELENPEKKRGKDEKNFFKKWLRFE